MNGMDHRPPIWLTTMPHDPLFLCLPTSCVRSFRGWGFPTLSSDFAGSFKAPVLRGWGDLPRSASLAARVGLLSTSSLSTLHGLRTC